MKTKKCKISLTLILILIISSISVVKIPAKAYNETYPNKYTYIRNAPYWFCSVADQFSTQQKVEPIEREGNYVYIQYEKNGELKRGYMPLADLDNPPTIWCNYNIFNPGKSVYSGTITMRYGPGSDYGVVATLPANIGTTSNNPLLVLKKSGGYYQVQYVANSSVTDNSVQPQYCRGWVPTTQIQVTNPTASTYLGSSEISLIRNTSNGKYLTVVTSPSSSTGYRAVLADPTGYREQHWRIKKYEDTSGGIYYKIISVSTGYCLQVKDDLPISGTTIELDTNVNPAKSQEFEMKEISNAVINNEIVGKIYNIKTRITGSYQCFDISDENTIELRANGSQSQKWAVERLNKYHDNLYINLPKNGNTYTLKYYLYDLYDQFELTSMEVEDKLECWEINTANGTKCVNIERTSLESEANVLIYAKDIGIGRVAWQLPTIISNGTELTSVPNVQVYSNHNWNRSKIELNSNIEYMYSLKNIQLERVKLNAIAHEFGHSLKLKHPYGNISSDFSDQVVFSIMNQGTFNAQDYGIPEMKVVYEPSYYDKQTLINKWIN